MFTLGIIGSQARQCTRILRHNKSEPIDFNMYKQDDGFYIFEFPDMDYYDFKDIVILLQNNGITTIGADSQLTENKLMKLTNILKEQEEERPNRMETAEDIIEMVDEIITDNPDTALDLLADMVEDFYENQSIDRPDVNEQKLKKLIKTLVKEWHEQN
jgi:hypothetical protein